MITEEAEYDVTLTIRLRTNVSFSAIERDGLICKEDAIQNAIGSMPDTVVDAIRHGFGGEFEDAIIEGEATRLWGIFCTSDDPANHQGKSCPLHES